MRKSLGVAAACFLMLFFLASSAHSSTRRAKPAKNPAKAHKAHRPSAGRLKAARKVKSASLRFSRRLAEAEEEPVLLKNSHGRKTAGRASKRRAPLVKEAAANEPDNDEYMEYRMKRGDTLEKLAQRFNIEKEEITDLNRVARRRLTPGRSSLFRRRKRSRRKSPSCSRIGPRNPGRMKKNAAFSSRSQRVFPALLTGSAGTACGASIVRRS